MAKQNYKNIDRGVFFHTHFATESLLCVERRQVNALKSNVIRLRAPSAIGKNGLILRNILMQKVYVCVLLNKSTKTLCDYLGRRTLPQKEEMSSKKNKRMWRVTVPSPCHFGPRDSPHFAFYWCYLVVVLPMVKRWNFFYFIFFNSSCVYLRSC